MTDVQETTTTRLDMSLSDRIQAARAELAAQRAEQGAVADQGKIDKFTWLVEKLFGETVIADLDGEVVWRDEPVLVFNVGGEERQIFAKPEWTGHVSWQLDGIELFKQKYAPPPAEAMDTLIMALARETTPQA